MVSSSYEPLPTSSSATYPPPPPSRLTTTLRSLNPFPSQPEPSSPPYPLKARRINLQTALKYLLGASAGLLVLHYVFVGAFPDSRYTATFRGTVGHWKQDGQYAEAAAAADAVLSKLDPSAGQPGTFFRDSYPIRSMLAFWELAEKEAEARGVDTCHDQLGQSLIDAYYRSEVQYCVPEGVTGLQLAPVRNNSHTPHWAGQPVPPTTIACAPIHRDDFSKWWPYPAAPCLSTNIRAVKGDDRKFKAAGCKVTNDGANLMTEMGNERFLGKEITRVGLDEEAAQCKLLVERTVLVIGRQDQWNPFHVAEDLITTLVTVFIAARMAPDLINTRVQLVFAEGFGMDKNHFTPLWDRMGAWAPRRLSLDPWGDGECLSNTIHSVGAGASLLSAMGVGKSYSCASTITWAASHYYRHLFGLLPPSLSLPANLMESHHLEGRPRRPINVLWLSRAKLDQYAQSHNDWSTWRDVRHINNEAELIKRLRAGLNQLCEESMDTKEFGRTGCVFEDAQEVPETWALTSPESVGDEEPLPVRFAMLDPTVHALETQIHFVGHTTVLVSSHGGALGLALFLPPGDAAIVELQVDGVRGNYHFEHMALEMGHEYEVLGISRTVNVDQVWESVRRRVWKIAQTG